MEKKRIVKNLALSIVGQLCSWILAFVVNIYLPRYAGAGGLGKFAIVGSIIAIIGALTTLGTTTVLVREVARTPEKSEELFSSSLWLRLGLTVLLTLCLLICIYTTVMPATLRAIFTVNCIGLFFSFFNDAASAVLQGREKFAYSNIVLLSDRIISSALIVVGISMHFPLWGLAAVPLFSAIAQSILFIFLLGRLQVRWIIVPRQSVQKIALAGLPFLSLALFRIMYGQTDPLVINFFAGEQPCGWYALALRLVGTVLFLPSAMYTVLFPWMARQNSDDSGEQKAVVGAQRMAEINILYGVLMTVFFAQSAPAILAALHYPASFNQAIPVLALSGLSAWMTGLGICFGGLLSALNRQAILWRLSLAACIVGITLCFFFSYLTHRLWQNAAIGALASDIVLEVLLVVGYVLALPKGVWNAQLTNYTIRCMLCGLGMAIVDGMLYRYGAGLWAAGIGTATYLICCFILQLLGKREWEILESILNKRKARA